VIRGLDEEIVWNDSSGSDNRSCGYLAAVTVGYAEERLPGVDEAVGGRHDNVFFINTDVAADGGEDGGFTAEDGELIWAVDEKDFGVGEGVGDVILVGDKVVFTDDALGDGSLVFDDGARSDVGETEDGVSAHADIIAKDASFDHGGGMDLASLAAFVDEAEGAVMGSQAPGFGPEAFWDEAGDGVGTGNIESGICPEEVEGVSQGADELG